MRDEYITQPQLSRNPRQPAIRHKIYLFYITLRCPETVWRQTSEVVPMRQLFLLCFFFICSYCFREGEHNCFVLSLYRFVLSLHVTTPLSSAFEGMCSLTGDFPVISRAGGYKIFFVLNSDEHEICPANKSQITLSC